MSFDTETSGIFAEMFTDFCRDVASEEGTIVFEKLTPGNNAPQDLFSLPASSVELEYRNGTTGRNLPEGIESELRIKESDLNASDFVGFCSIKHVTDSRTFRFGATLALRGYPSRFSRVWRFWLNPAELVPQAARQFWLGTHNNEILVTHHGEGIATNQ